MKTKLMAMGVALTMLFAGAAQASTSLTSSAAGYSGPTLNLTAYANGMYNFTFGPVPVANGFTFIANPGCSGGYPCGGNSGKGSVIGQGGYGLGANGSFGGPAVYIGVDSGTGYDQLQLASPVSQIGFYFNYAPGFGSDATISTLDKNYNVVDSYDLTTLAPISTPGGFNQFEFRGIISTATDIYGLQFGGNYILVAGSPTGAATVPEPATWAVMLVGFGGLGLALRSSRRRQALTA